MVFHNQLYRYVKGGLEILSDLYKFIYQISVRANGRI